MSYRLEGKDLVIDGFEEGIADSPYKGIADMRNVNLISEPGEMPVNYKTQALTIPPAVNALAFTAVAATDIFTVASTSGWYKGMAIQLDTNSAGGVTTGVVYYVGSISGNTFKLYADSFKATAPLSPINISGDGSGTLTTFQLAKLMHQCSDKGQVFGSQNNGVPSLASFMIDSKNQTWLLIPYGITTGAYLAGSIIYLGNLGSTIFTGDNSIAVWANYLFVFRFGATDIWNMSLQTAPATAWIFGWAGFSPNPTPASASLRSLVGQDDAIYICNGSSVASILENAGETFDPTDSTTYTANNAALALPVGENATCLAELGTTLLVGGIGTYVYPWDRVSTSYNYPIVVPERYISLIVSTNSNAYIFAGNRGRIYITNGANIDLLKKIPDYISGVLQPYYLTGGVGSVSASTSGATTARGDAIYWRGQLYFTMVAFEQGNNTALTTVTGVWAINLDTNALRLVLKLSYDAYSGIIPVLVPDMDSFRPGGEGMYAGWTDVNGTPGIDVGISSPYANYETYMDTDLIPVGTFLDPFTPSQIEWKASSKLVSGEGVRISYRTNLTDAFALIGESTTVGSFSDVYQANFEKAQWVQLRIETKSTASTPSFTRITELRIRDWPSGKNA